MQNAKAHLYLSGNVQGVGMRAFVHVAASRLKLAGFVKNLPDGRVEAVFEGNRKSIQKILESLKNGSLARNIQNLDLQWEDPTHEFKGFEIKF